MQSFHQVTGFRAKQPYPESNYIRLTIVGVEDEVEVVIHLAMPTASPQQTAEFAAILAKAINELPKLGETLG